LFKVIIPTREHESRVESTQTLETPSKGDGLRGKWDWLEYVIGVQDGAKDLGGLKKKTNQRILGGGWSKAATKDLQKKKVGRRCHLSVLSPEGEIFWGRGAATIQVNDVVFPGHR